MLEQIHEFIKDYHVWQWGVAALVGLFAVTVCFRTVWGTWKRSDKCKLIKR